MSKRRVVFVVHSLRAGGAERQVVDLVNHLDRERFDATLFTFDASVDLAALVRDHVTMARFPRQFKLDVRPIVQLASLIRKERVELVHCTLQMALLVARSAVLLSDRKVKLIDALHSTKNRGLKEEIADRLLYVRLMAGCDRITTVCDAQRRHWVAKYPSLASRMVTIHNGIEMDAYRDDVPERAKAALRRQLGIEDHDLVLAMVAAIRPEKNHQGVLEALGRLAPRGRRVRLLCAGGTLSVFKALEARLRERTQALGLQTTVEWLGKVNGSKEILSIADAVVMFSHTESLPMALLESLAMGKPIVSSRVGGIPEVVEDEVNGLLVPPGDVSALVRAIGRLRDDEDLLRRMKERARPSVEAHFSVGEMTRQTEEMIVEVLAPRVSLERARA